MTKFVAPLPSMAVALHDEEGNRIGVAQFRGGQWTAPNDALAEALQRAHVFGVEESTGDEAQRRGPFSANQRKAGKVPPRQKHGAVTATTRHTEEEPSDA